jgi:hypothetical protein
VEDRIRKVDVRLQIVHARVDPTWANPGHPSPLSVPLGPCLSGSPVSGTTRVPAPQRKPHAIRGVRESARCRISASASANLLSMLSEQTRHPPKFMVHPILTFIHLSSIAARLFPLDDSHTFLTPALSLSGFIVTHKSASHCRIWSQLPKRLSNPLDLDGGGSGWGEGLAGPCRGGQPSV